MDQDIDSNSQNLSKIQSSSSTYTQKHNRLLLFTKILSAPLKIKVIIAISMLMVVIFVVVGSVLQSRYNALFPYHIRLMAHNCGSYFVYIGDETRGSSNSDFFKTLKNRTNECFMKAFNNCRPVSAKVYFADWLGGKGEVTYTIIQSEEKQKGCTVEIQSQTNAAYYNDYNNPQKYKCSNVDIIDSRLAYPDCYGEDMYYDFCIDPLYSYSGFLGRCVIDYGIALKNIKICNVLKEKEDIENCLKHVAQSQDTLDACLAVENRGSAFATCIINYASRNQDSSACSLFAERGKWLLEEICYSTSGMDGNRLDEILRESTFTNLEVFTEECRSYADSYHQSICFDRIYRGLVYNSGKLVHQGKENVHKWCLNQPINDIWEMCLYSNEMGYSNPSTLLSLGESDDLNLLLGEEMRKNILDHSTENYEWQDNICQAIRWKTSGDEWNITDDLQSYGLTVCGYSFLSTGYKGGYQ
jgi:hypothetical protein